MADDKLRITLKIDGVAYPLTIARDKEERYRRAERELNALILKFKSKYKGKSETYLALSALQLSITNVEQEFQRTLHSDKFELEQLDRELDEYLKSIE